MIAAAGEAWCFVIDAVSYLAVVAALLAMRLPKRERPHAGRVHRPAHDRGRAVRVRLPPDPRAPACCWRWSASPRMPYSVLLPVFAADVLGGGPHTLGLLSAASGVGALAGGVYLASRSSVLGLGRVIVVADGRTRASGWSGSRSREWSWLSAGAAGARPGPG